MNRIVLGASCLILAIRGAAADEQYGVQRTIIEIGKHKGFILQPAKPAKERPWVWYAPTIGSYPNQSNEWVLRKLLDSGFFVCGINVGESYGSPAGRKVYSDFHQHLVREYKLEPKARLLAQSRGGLMLYNWAAENPNKVRCIVGIYPVCDLRSYPGLPKAASAYGMTPAELEKQLSQHNPIDRLESLAKAGVPILHIHGNADTVVPLEKNSQVMLDRYSALGGKMKLIVIAGKGHAEIPEYFQEPRLVKFLMEGGFSAVRENDEQQVDCSNEITFQSASKERRRQDAQEFHLLAQQRTGLLIPLYVYPGDLNKNPAYNRLIELRRRYETVPVWVIVNPASGPGNDRDPNYTQAIDRLVGAGCVLLGYVTTSYGKRAEADVQKEIDRWAELYPRVHGIFFDEMVYDDTPAGAKYQSNLNRYARDNGWWPTVGNPGADTPNRYFTAKAADVIVIHEGNAWPKDDRLRSYADHPPFTRALLLHSQDKLDAGAVQMARRQVRWVYVTEGLFRAGDPKAANPWDRLSKHLDELCKLLVKD